MDTSVQKHVLENGLTVLLKPIAHTPLVSWRVMYRVGSRNEQTGQTGISHWVEHMMFKGTPDFPGDQLDRMIDREGGYWNAHTFMDFTAYFETMPADRIDLALRLEADRMVNAIFEPDEVARERTVIISERQGSENSPLFWLREEVSAAAFRVHPYHHEIIGDMADLHTMTRDDLYNHYRRYYTPNNAVAVAVGSFDPARMLNRIRELYGSIPPGDPPPPVTRTEPEQVGERRVRVERPGQTTFLIYAYKSPAATDPDWFKLAVLASVLGGPSLLGGAAIDNKTSRLYRALVLSGLAADVQLSFYPTIDPYLFSIYVTLREDSDPSAVEAALEEELSRIRQQPISPAELEKAIKQARALFAYSTEGVTGQGFWLAFCENFDSYEWFERYVERLSAVTVDDVQTAAQQYLIPQRRTVGWYIPTGTAEGAQA